MTVEFPAGKRQTNNWTLHEDTEIHRVWPCAPLLEVQAALPRRSLCAIRWRARLLGVRRVRPGKPHGRRVEPLFANLKRIRLSRSITQVALAKRMGVDQTTLSDWETGKMGPHWFQLRVWLDALEIDLVARERPMVRRAA